jgi:hypothetical protein
MLMFYRDNRLVEGGKGRELGIPFSYYPMTF